MRLRALLAALILICAPVIADEPPLKALVFDFAPWGYLEDGRPAGLNVAVFEALSRESGLPIEPILMPYQRMLALLEAGEGDLAIFFTSPESQVIAHQIASVYRLESVLLVRHDFNRAPDISGLPPNLVVATARGVRIDTIFDQAQTYINVPTNGGPHAARLLLSGRVESIAGPYRPLLLLVEAAGGSRDDVKIFKSITVNEGWLQMSKNSMRLALKDRITEAMARLEARGEIEPTVLTYIPDIRSKHDPVDD